MESNRLQIAYYRLTDHLQMFWFLCAAHSIENNQGLGPIPVPWPETTEVEPSSGMLLDCLLLRFSCSNIVLQIN
ncbi:hypothetical protein ACROYT_G031867 [Oculina patagonica]